MIPAPQLTTSGPCSGTPAALNTACGREREPFVGMEGRDHLGAPLLVLALSACFCLSAAAAAVAPQQQQPSSNKQQREGAAVRSNRKELREGATGRSNGKEQREGATGRSNGKEQREGAAGRSSRSSRSKNSRSSSPPPHSPTCLTCSPAARPWASAIPSRPARLQRGGSSTPAHVPPSALRWAQTPAP